MGTRGEPGGGVQAAQAQLPCLDVQARLGGRLVQVGVGGGEGLRLRGWRGAEAVDDAISELVAGEAELLEGLSKGDQERLAALLRKLSLDFDEQAPAE